MLEDVGHAGAAVLDEGSEAGAGQLLDRDASIDALAQELRIVELLQDRRVHTGVTMDVPSLGGGERHQRAIALEQSILLEDQEVAHRREAGDHLVLEVRNVQRPAVHGGRALRRGAPERSTTASRMRSVLTSIQASAGRACSASA